eukprot:280190_1
MSTLATHEYVQIICEMTVSLADFTLLFTLIHRVKKMPKNERDKSKTLIRITLAIFIGFSICFTLNPLRILLFGTNRFDSTLTILLYSISIVCGIVSALLIYIFIAVQLYTIFKETKFKLKRCIILIHCVIFIAVIALNIARVLSQLLSQSLLENICGILSILTLSFGIFHFVWLLNKKLYLLTVEQAHHLKSLSNTNIEEELVLFPVIVKVSVLITYNIVSTVGLIIIGIVLTVIGGEISVILFWIIWVFWASVASLSIFLLLSINDALYTTVCRVCHARLQRICHSIASLPTKESTPQHQSETSHSILKMMTLKVNAPPDLTVPSLSPAASNHKDSTACTPTTPNTPDSPS